MEHSDAGRTRLRAVLERFVTEPSEVEAVFGGAPLLETITIDSIVFVHLVAALETEFAVRFDFESIEAAFASVDSLLTFVTRQAGGAAG